MIINVSNLQVWLFSGKTTVDEVFLSLLHDDLLLTDSDLQYVDQDIFRGHSVKGYYVAQ